VGPLEINHVNTFNVTEQFGAEHALPTVEDSGRIANLPICHSPRTPTKAHRLVVCTWAAAIYRRRGNTTVVGDAADRLLEWILFHRLAGVDHIYLYDNTPLIPT
jgi:hypothetical protein